MTYQYYIETCIIASERLSFITNLINSSWYLLKINIWILYKVSLAVLSPHLSKSLSSFTLLALFYTATIFRVAIE